MRKASFSFESAARGAGFFKKSPIGINDTYALAKTYRSKIKTVKIMAISADLYFCEIFASKKSSAVAESTTREKIRKRLSRVGNLKRLKRGISLVSARNTGVFLPRIITNEINARNKK